MYEIVIAGRLPRDWRVYFEDLHAEVAETPEGTFTLLIGNVPDQAALHGVLARLRDLVLPIISIRLLDTPSGDANTPLGT